jgi:hypothetical protein
MRFCPFCSAENPDEQTVCTSCGRRLPPLPPRRKDRNAPPTGVMLPPRPAPPQRRSSTSNPPPIASSGTPDVTVPDAQAYKSGPTEDGTTSVRMTTDARDAREADVTTVSPDPTRAPSSTTATSSGFAAAPSPSTTSQGFAPRGRTTSSPPPLPRAGSTTNPPPVRTASTTQPPPVRRGSPTNPPPLPTNHDRSDPTVRVNEGSQVAPLPIPRTGVMASPGSRQARAGSHAEIGPPPARESAPALPPPPKTNVVPPSAFGDDFHTMEAQPYDIVSAKREPGGPPPTRIHNPELHADRPFQPPKVHPVPEIPEPGLYNAAKYTLRFLRAWYQRRGAIRTLREEIKADTDALDQVLGALGKITRQQRVDSKVFHAENIAINAAEERIGVLGKEQHDVDARRAEENSKFVDVEREKTTKLSEAERLVDESGKELANLEGQRRGLRDKRKELERRQKAYLKSAEDSDKQSGAAQMGDTRAELRRGAEQMRKEAAALEPDRQEVDRRLASLERPIGEATAKLDAAKAELDAAKRSLSDAREGHTHRLAELDAEQKRKSREIGQSESEIARRLVTLGTLVNLNRIEHPAFSELYQRIDRLRGAITARTTEIEKLTAEREAYDRGTMVRGAAAIGGAVVVLIALIVILRAIF